MQAFYFLAIFFLAIRLKKVFRFTPVYQKWRSLFNYAWLVMLLFAVLQYQFGNITTGFIGCFSLIGVLYYLDKEPEFEPFKFYLHAHYPLIIVGLLDNLTQLVSFSFYYKWDNYFNFAILGAFAYIFARWANAKKQREELIVANARNNELDRLVTERTAELTRQKDELQETVKLLQATQAQLIQQEKLASLGELTAGIAHEIQNPLNFVNNFSEVSIELIDEMTDELGKGDTEEAIAIAGDLKQNLEKIIHHGRRADGIVKGMLQHSRSGGDTKEPTDINKLADEYFRLAYHGLRAKDKAFNAELVTTFAPDLPLVPMVPQDIGRVLLNLFNNAFYATQHKKETAGANYKPTVEIITSVEGKSVKIAVKDNGIGIPDAIKEKIMQPFFTTKPTGEGTGLGLSLSYDIVVKAQGGSIDIEGKEGVGSIFIIKLPL